MQEIKCAECNGSLEERLKKYSKLKYCSKKCQRDFTKKKYYLRNGGMGINALVTGTINEYLAIADLLKKGFLVYKSCANFGCDLMAFKNEKPYRIEVTTGHISSAGKLFKPSKKYQKFDILAIVINGNEIIYEPNLPE